MNAFQFIATCLLLGACVVIAVKQYKKALKDRLVELKCKFFISDNSDIVLDSHKEHTGVQVDGILGNDFMVRHGYIIDYEDLQVKHKSVKISIKEVMDIVEIPLIVLYHNGEKYVFMLDTGAQNSLIHSRCLETMQYEDCDEKMMIAGYGGSGMTNKSILTSLYYAKKRHKAD